MKTRTGAPMPARGWGSSSGQTHAGNEPKPDILGQSHSDPVAQTVAGRHTSLSRSACKRRRFQSGAERWQGQKCKARGAAKCAQHKLPIRPSSSTYCALGTIPMHIWRIYRVHAETWQHEDPPRADPGTRISFFVPGGERASVIERPALVEVPHCGTRRAKMRPGKAMQGARSNSQ